MHDPKNRQKFAIWAPSHNFVCYTFAIQARIDNRKNLLNSNVFPTCLHNMVNFGPLCWQVWSTPPQFNGFSVLAALLHGTLVVGVSQTLRRWTHGATYIWQGGHHVGHLLPRDALQCIAQYWQSNPVRYVRALWLNNITTHCTAVLMALTYQ